MMTEPARDGSFGQSSPIHRFVTHRLQSAVYGRMKDAGCDAVVLGCTEIPLIMNDTNSPLPTLDSTRLLARAALRRTVVLPGVSD